MTVWQSQITVQEPNILRITIKFKRSFKKLKIILQALNLHPSDPNGKVGYSLLNKLR